MMIIINGCNGNGLSYNETISSMCIIVRVWISEYQQGDHLIVLVVFSNHLLWF